jgi:AraC-like DNA-binding protein/mannose-6-phosphate isomerase-like protein (cupin superfamily)
MDEEILSRLSVLTDEEQRILSGMNTIDRSIYMEGTEDIIAGHKLLEPGKLMAVRPHTRFVHFPEHTHDYVEMVYVCQGTARHLINGAEILLRQGELLVLGQNTRQEIFPAREQDISVNFIVRPELFGGILDYLGNEETPLREFIVGCLCGENPSGYLLFRVSDVKPIQNLVENLLWTLFSNLPNRRSINQLTMGLLLMQLLNHTDKLTTGVPEQETIVHVLRYIEDNYCSGSLTDAAKLLHYDTAWLSREIKRRTGKNYTQLVQDKRLSQAAWLLKNTTHNVSDIAASVGYENLSYFHRLFSTHFGMSPKQYRICK